MAPLPSSRITPARAFSRTGIDYAGPFKVLASRGRGIYTTKAYIAVFVCMCTKALHLELVGDLTTVSFLGALSRFCGWRGRPAQLWSDNAICFRGVDAELQEALREAEFQWDLVAGTLAKQGVSRSTRREPRQAEPLVSCARNAQPFLATLEPRVLKYTAAALSKRTTPQRNFVVEDVVVLLNTTLI
ncbi:uncharacterized protein LOC106640311 [Copidosoma floridanum]|uniref:uncharacterized protein LOC106640311 n=1 Tax=Copidosoma floridanum TaxID=29053 RepID=UPI0006C94C7A|nr:uncharacterized protein LOC106640311 [Copidosoma floridanum]